MIGQGRGTHLENLQKDRVVGGGALTADVDVIRIREPGRHPHQALRLASGLRIAEDRALDHSVERHVDAHADTEGRHHENENERTPNQPTPRVSHDRDHVRTPESR
jgi:hypothetical protein